MRKLFEWSPRSRRRDTYHFLVMMGRRYLQVMANLQLGHELRYIFLQRLGLEGVEIVQVLHHTATVVRLFGRLRVEHLPRHTDPVQHVHDDDLVR